MDEGEEGHPVYEAAIEKRKNMTVAERLRDDFHIGGHWPNRYVKPQDGSNYPEEFDDDGEFARKFIIRGGMVNSKTALYNEE